MDLNKKAAQSPYDAELRKNDNFGDTTLCLNGIGFGETMTNYRCTKSNLGMKFQNASDDGCRLVLGLGPTPMAYDDDYNNLGFNKKKNSASPFPQHMPSECDSILQLGLSGGNNEASSVLECSGSTEADVNMSHFSSQTFAENNYSTSRVPVVDEGSTSAKKSGGYMPSLLLAPRMDNVKSSVQPQELILATNHQLSLETSSATTYSHGDGSSLQATGITSDIRTSNPKRCQKPGCNKGAESRTAYCKAHGGGRRRVYKAARGKSGLCIRHGGGKRCRIDGCTRSAEGKLDCAFLMGVDAVVSTRDVPRVHKGAPCSAKHMAVGSVAHLQVVPKSVHGGTNFCVAHGGGKRCAVAGCTKSARGRTDCCVRHGGGKRCKFEGCGKSAQGSTDFARHMVEERDVAGEMENVRNLQGKEWALCCTQQLGPRAFDNNSSSGVSVVSDSYDSMETPAKRQQLIPKEVLVPLSMKSPSYPNLLLLPRSQSRIETATVLLPVAVACGKALNCQREGSTVETSCCILEGISRTHLMESEIKGRSGD
ncbi:putative WRKY transcription factor [Arachis hypogaea]|nr:putative WRKY transcription factor [Arachis hypogaea]